MEHHCRYYYIPLVQLLPSGCVCHSYMFNGNVTIKQRVTPFLLFRALRIHEIYALCVFNIIYYLHLTLFMTSFYYRAARNCHQIRMISSMLDQKN